ncbi:MAG TPA: AAA family ATPase [Cyanobacteria bacterium UBA8543]|nr:AAA family ATPase [Cyanobacteria bacterium UBA8543]
MNGNRFPPELLSLPVAQRIAYFNDYTMAHPRLVEAFVDLKRAIYQAPGVSLIFVFGPTGVGKTTLLRRLIQKITSATLPELEVDKGQMPIVGIEAMSPEFSQFDWKDFYLRILKALNEPLIDKKISYRDTKLKLRHAVESALINRHPDALYIDEAHHLAKLASGRKLKDQPEALKSLSSLAKVRIVMVGTYDLMPLINLGDQLCRRSKSIHFPLYHADCDEDVFAFKSVLHTFERHLPLPEAPDLLQHWEDCYIHSVGCVGVLKDWLSQTLSAVLEERPDSPTITLKDLSQHALPVSQCLIMLKAAQQGEEKLKNTQAELDQLRSAMGLLRKFPQMSTETTDSTSEQQPNPPFSRTKNKNVGKSKPRRYRVGGSSQC